jgi:hypothetical protein
MTAKYVLRNLPGVADLEARVARIEAHANPEWAPDIDGLWDHVDEVSGRLFSLKASELEDGVAEDAEETEFCAIVAQELGWDLTGSDGKRLMCFEYLAAPIIYASRGLKGRMPDQPMSDEEAASDAELWARKLLKR